MLTSSPSKDRVRTLAGMQAQATMDTHGDGMAGAHRIKIDQGYLATRGQKVIEALRRYEAETACLSEIYKVPGAMQQHAEMRYNDTVIRSGSNVGGNAQPQGHALGTAGLPRTLSHVHSTGTSMDTFTPSPLSMTSRHNMSSSSAMQISAHAPDTSPSSANRTTMAGLDTSPSSANRTTMPDTSPSSANRTTMPGLVGVADNINQFPRSTPSGKATGPDDYWASNDAPRILVEHTVAVAGGNSGSFGSFSTAAVAGGNSGSFGSFSSDSDGGMLARAGQHDDAMDQDHAENDVPLGTAMCTRSPALWHCVRVSSLWHCVRVSSLCMHSIQCWCSNSFNLVYRHRLFPEFITPQIK